MVREVIFLQIPEGGEGACLSYLQGKHSKWAWGKGKDPGLGVCLVYNIWEKARRPVGFRQNEPGRTLQEMRWGQGKGKSYAGWWCLLKLPLGLISFTAQDTVIPSIQNHLYIVLQIDCICLLCLSKLTPLHTSSLRKKDWSLPVSHCHGEVVGKFETRNIWGASGTEVKWWNEDHGSHRNANSTGEHL